MCFILFDWIHSVCRPTIHFAVNKEGGTFSFINNCSIGDDAMKWIYAQFVPVFISSSVVEF